MFFCPCSRYGLLLSVSLLSACARFPSSSGAGEIRLQLGLQYLFMKDYPSAARNLRKAHQSDPSDYRPLLGLAKLNQEQSDDDQARFWYTQALQKVPENGYVLNNYGDFLCYLRQYDKAHKLFRRAERSEEPAVRSEAIFYSALCYLSAGSKLLAKQRLQGIHLNFPAMAEKLLNQAEYWISKQRWDNADLLLEYYHQRFSPTAESLWSVIYVAARQGKNTVVERYGSLLARNFPHSIQYQRYIANEY